LLVVVGIIAVLLSLILPVIDRAREQSNRVKCASHLRQIMAAALAHSADNDKGPVLPTPDNDTDTFEPLYPRYLSDFRIFVCPRTVNRVDDVAHLRNNARDAYDQDSGHSYEIRSRTRKDVTFPDGSRFAKETQKDPRRFKGNGCIVMDADDDSDGDGGEENNWPDHPTDNHGAEGYNVGFLDGHVEFIPPSRALLEAYLEGYYDPDLPGAIYNAHGVIKQGNVFRYR